MKKYIYLIVLFAATVLVTGCDRDEYLDIKPFGQVIPSKVEDYRLMMDQWDSWPFIEESVYNGITTSYGIDFFMSDDVRLAEGDENRYLEHDDLRPFNAVQWDENFGQPNDADMDLKGLYNVIRIANIVLEAMDDPATEGSEAEKNELRAEAYYHRAFSHFSAVNLYSPHYTAENANTPGLGMPIVLTATNPSFERSTIQEVYDQVFADLELALNSNALQAARAENTFVRPTVASIYALQARIHLFMGNYTDALTAANESLALYDTLVNLTETFFVRENYFNLEVYNLKSFPGVSIFSGIPVSDSLVALYDADDVRGFTYITEDFNEEGSFNFDLGFYYYTSPGVPEMYLTRAECNARPGGDLSQVHNDLNTLRANRIDLYEPMDPFTDAAAALAFVQDERRRELPRKGVRLFDLKRYNALDNAGITLERENGLRLEPNSNRWVAPITRRDLQLSPGLTQLPRD